jgi:hypothetical protein
MLIMNIAYIHGFNYHHHLVLNSHNCEYLLGYCRAWSACAITSYMEMLFMNIDNKHGIIGYYWNISFFKKLQNFYLILV